MPKLIPGKRPTSLGITDGKLKACPKSPNCVSSQSSSPKHFIGPLVIHQSAAHTMNALKAALNKLPRTTIVAESDDYIHAECASSLFGFVDDVEFWHNPTAGHIEVRSASRVGYSDWGVNRKRIEALRKTIS